MLKIIIMFIVIIGIYLVFSVLAMAYHVKSLEEKPDNISNKESAKKSWTNYNRYEILKTGIVLLVLAISFVGFIIETSGEKEPSLHSVIIYTLIVLTSLSSLFDLLEKRVERARELGIQRGKKDKVNSRLVKIIKK